MPQGLQIWDASGNLILDTSNRIGRVLGVVTLDGNTSSSETNDGLLTGTPFYMVVFLGSFATYSPTISIASNVISWTMPSGAAGNFYRLVYGVY